MNGNTRVEHMRKWRPTKRQKFELAFFAVSALVILISFLPVIVHASWPSNGEYLRFMSRTEIYAEHFKHGDLLPIWSTDDAFSMGSPLPLFYHKLFYYVSASIFLLVGPIKLAILLTIALFMLIGVYGMRYCVKMFTTQKAALLLVPQVLLLSNYTITDWSVRGAMAEFSAMMLVPWLLWWCLRLVRDKKFSLSLILIMFLLVEAHNVVALFGLIPLGVAFYLFLHQEKMAGLKHTYKKLIVSAVSVAALLTPQLLLQVAFLSAYNPSHITNAGYKASQNYLSLSKYVFLSKYGLWLLLAASAAATIMYFYAKRGSRGLKNNRLSPTAWFFILTLLILAILQLPISRTIYNHVSLMQFLQFPWRLLIYVVPLGIIAVLIVVVQATNSAEQGKSKKLRNFVGAWLACTLLFSSVFNVSESTLSTAYFYYYKAPGYEIGGLWLNLAGDFLPRTLSDGVELNSKAMKKMYTDMFTDDKRTEILNGGPCVFNKRHVDTSESPVLTFDVTCKAPAAVALPISYNDYTEIKSSDGRMINYQRKYPSDPRIVIDMPAATTVLEARLPTALTVLRKTWRIND